MTLCPISLEVSALDTSPFPLDIALVKSHLAEDSTDNDTLIESLMRAAIEWAEGSMRRTIYARSHIWVLQDFPTDLYGKIRLPRGKTQSVESVAYSNGGAITTLTGPSSAIPGTGYQEDLRGNDGGFIMPPRSQSWPSVDLDVPAPVAITYTAGWLAAEVPEDIVHGLLFAISDGYENRGVADITVGQNFNTRESLISANRLHRWY
jgi:uncharacterized phiE125 gp8 family phage protein